jgi:hypothetical protein
MLSTSEVRARSVSKGGKTHASVAATRYQEEISLMLKVGDRDGRGGSCSAMQWGFRWKA